MSEVIAEVQGPLVFRIVHDKELGYLYAQIPVDKKLTQAVVRDIITATHDPWRYVDGLGLILDISAWTGENELDLQAVSKALEAKYKEILDVIKKIVEEAREAKPRRKKKRSRKKKRKKSKKSSRKRSRKSKK